MKNKLCKLRECGDNLFMGDCLGKEVKSDAIGVWA